MGFRFWRRVKIAPGVTINLSKGAASVSFGPQGAKFTVGTRGARATAGVPGTGLFYTQKLGGRERASRRAPTGTRARGRAGSEALEPGFFKRLLIPAGEEALIDGCRELTLGHQPQALGHLREATHLADGAFLAGCVALQQGHLDEAEQYLEKAVANAGQLGKQLSRHGIDLEVGLDITDEVSARIAPSRPGALLALVEVHQQTEHPERALASLEELRRRLPHDAVVRLSLVELLVEAHLGERAGARRVVHLTQQVRNESPLHTALLLYRARAFRTLGLHVAARDTCSHALRRRKNRPADLLLALRYERALAYEALGQPRRYRTELERIYASDPAFEEVAARLESERASTRALRPTD